MTAPLQRARKRWPCVLKGPLARDANERLWRLWRERHPGEAMPLGAFIQQWRRIHCRTLNPYGSDGCAYEPRDCVLAFYIVAELAIREGEAPVALFSQRAFAAALDRADRKPLARDRMVGRETQGPGDPRAAPEGPASGPGLRRARTRPVAISDVLGSFDFGPRPRHRDDGQEGPLE